VIFRNDEAFEKDTFACYGCDCRRALASTIQNPLARFPPMQTSSGFCWLEPWRTENLGFSRQTGEIKALKQAVAASLLLSFAGPLKVLQPGD
jgi:hypothetical protein